MKVDMRLDGANVCAASNLAGTAGKSSDAWNAQNVCCNNRGGTFGKAANSLMSATMEAYS